MKNRSIQKKGRRSLPFNGDQVDCEYHYWFSWWGSSLMVQNISTTQTVKKCALYECLQGCSAKNIPNQDDWPLISKKCRSFWQQIFLPCLFRFIAYLFCQRNNQKISVLSITAMLLCVFRRFCSIWHGSFHWGWGYQGFGGYEMMLSDNYLVADHCGRFLLSKAPLYNLDSYWFFKLLAGQWMGIEDSLLLGLGCLPD